MNDIVKSFHIETFFNTLKVEQREKSITIYKVWGNSEKEAFGLSLTLEDLKKIIEALQKDCSPELEDLQEKIEERKPF